MDIQKQNWTRRVTRSLPRNVSIAPYHPSTTSRQKRTLLQGGKELGDVGDVGAVGAGPSKYRRSSVSGRDEGTKNMQSVLDKVSENNKYPEGFGVIGGKFTEIKIGKDGFNGKMGSAHLDIPKGALSKQTKFSLRQMGSKDHLVGSNGENIVPYSKIYRGSTMPLRKEATLVFEHYAVLSNDSEAAKIKVWKRENDKRPWERLPDEQFVVKNSSVDVKLQGFSDIVAGTDYECIPDVPGPSRASTSANVDRLPDRRMVLVVGAGSDDNNEFILSFFLVLANSVGDQNVEDVRGIAGGSAKVAGPFHIDVSKDVSFETGGIKNVIPHSEHAVTGLYVTTSIKLGSFANRRDESVNISFSQLDKKPHASITTDGTHLKIERHDLCGFDQHMLQIRPSQSVQVADDTQRSFAT